MKQHCRRFWAIIAQSSIFAATVFGASYTQAATLGHSRVVSAFSEPLRIVVQLKELSPSDLKSISAQIAPVKAWQEAGLTPPVELSSLSTDLLPGHQDQVMQLVIQSHLAASSKVLDLLVDINTASSTQRHQVSVLQAQQGAPVHLAAAVTSVTPSSFTSSRVSTVSLAENTQTFKVKKGQHLYAIARKFRASDYSDQQLMAALVQANPDAFIQGNMNLLRAGATLTIPSTEIITAISPQQALQLYQEQLKQFDEYRQRIAKGEPPATIPIPTKTQKIDNKEVEVNTDRLQLSAQTDSDAKKDQQTATAQELAYTTQRLSQLESTSEIQAKTVGDMASGISVGSNANPIDGDAESEADSPASTLTAETALSDLNPAITNVSAGTATNAFDEAPSTTLSWWKSNAVILSIALFLLLIVLVVWLLRRVQSTRMEYAEMVASNSVRTREKVDPDEVEFREIK